MADNPGTMIPMAVRVTETTWAILCKKARAMTKVSSKTITVSDIIRAMIDEAFKKDGLR